MIPPFGFTTAERAASALLALAGAAGLLLTIMGRETGLAARLLGHPWPGWFLPNPGVPWLIIQSLLVTVGAVGALAWPRCFTLIAVGSIAGLLFMTPVGLLTTVPAIWMLVLIVLRRRAFWEFTPRWRGDGPPPPGQWR
jgi:hypothetical protein